MTISWVTNIITIFLKGSIVSLTILKRLRACITPILSP